MKYILPAVLLLVLFLMLPARLYTSLGFPATRHLTETSASVEPVSEAPTPGPEPVPDVRDSPYAEIAAEHLPRDDGDEDGGGTIENILRNTELTGSVYSLPRAQPSDEGSNASDPFAPREEAILEAAPDDIVATASATSSAPRPRSARLFAFPDEQNPGNFAAYGVIAFNSHPAFPEGSPDPEAARLRMICETFVSTLAARSEMAETPSERIVVTVWPMRNSATAAEANGSGRDTPLTASETCDVALPNYRLATSRVAIAAAVDSGQLNPSRRGPFLMAWQPGESFADPGQPILFDDMSGVTSADEARAHFAQWDSDIIHEDRYARALIERMGRLSYARLQLRAWADRDGGRVLRGIKTTLKLEGNADD